MAYDEMTASRVRRFLARRDNVVERKMMGALCFMVSGHMCCGVSGASLLVRVGPEAYQRLIGNPHVRPLEFAGRRPTGFVLVEPQGYRTARAFATWIRRGIDFVSTLPVKNPAAKEVSI